MKNQPEVKKIILKGIPASTGIAKGKVKIILDPSQNSKMEEGCILVTRITNPLYTPSILKAGAIITDEGGQLCHSAIIARELNIPAVVGTEKATTILKDGIKVIIDGDKGIIYG